MMTGTGIIKRLGLLLSMIIVLSLGQSQAATTLLPNGMQCFATVDGALSGGFVYMYQPNTTIFKQTWQDSNQSVMNTNPIVLDANGCAVIYGIGQYTQVVKDSLLNTVWTQLTTDTSAFNSVFWAGLSGGTPNAITVVDSGFNGTAGSIIQFIALNTNTGPATLNPSGYGAITIQKDTSTGPISLSAGDIVAGNTVTVSYNSTSNSFHIVGAVQASAASVVVQPQGYLTLLSAGSGGPIQTGDVTGATTVYYSPYVGNQIPIWNGTSFSVVSFAELQLTLTANWVANSIYDACVFLNSGTPVLVTGPAWQTSTPGSGARGSGAGTTQLFKKNGIWVNAVAMTGNNGANQYSIPINQCTYVGSIFIDGVNGQISAYRTYGQGITVSAVVQGRKFGVWNAYNRIPIIVKAGDSTATWVYSTNTIRPANNNANNAITTFTGLAEEQFNVNVFETAKANNGTVTKALIGWNSLTVGSGTGNLGQYMTADNQNRLLTSQYVNPPSLGINNVTILESGDGTATLTWSGTEAGNLLIVQWRG